MMTQTPTSSSSVTSDDAVKWVVILVLVFVALVAILITRRLVSPIDGLATQQVCNAHGDVISREPVSYERSNRIAVVGRSVGSCTFGPAEGATDDLVVPIPEANPSSTYRAVKVMTFVLQLGAASVAVRLLAEPLLDRFVRNPRS
jgi:hypothetical protein